MYASKRAGSLIDLVRKREKVEEIDRASRKCEGKKKTVKFYLKKPGEWLVGHEARIEERGEEEREDSNLYICI